MGGSVLVALLLRSEQGVTCFTRALNSHAQAAALVERLQGSRAHMRRPADGFGSNGYPDPSAWSELAEGPLRTTCGAAMVAWAEEE